MPTQNTSTCLARGRRRRNIISQLRVGDEIVRSQDLLEEAVFQHFYSVFGQAAQVGDELDLGELGFVASDLSALDLPFSPDEVWAAIRDMQSDHAPGPDWSQKFSPQNITSNLAVHV
jgi:hypothetical protein